MNKTTYHQDLECDGCGKNIDGTPNTCFCVNENCWCWDCYDRGNAKAESQTDLSEKER